MAGSVPKAISELEALLKQANDPQMRELINILLRLFRGSRESEQTTNQDHPRS
jgi:hypothetical protein